MGMTNKSKFFGWLVVSAIFLTGCDLAPEISVVQSGDFAPPEDMAIVELEDTADVGCFNNPQESRLVRGPVIASPDVRFLAYAEVQIVANSAGPEAYPPCTNTSRLFLMKPGSEEFESVFSRTPRDLVTGGSFWLVDWSPDNRYLLFGESEWEYDEDYYWRTYWLFNTEDNTPRPVNPDPMVAAHFGSECQAHAEFTGFTKEGKLVTVVAPETPLDFEPELQERFTRPETEEEETRPSCVERDTYFVLDTTANKLTLLPKDYVHTTYGLRE